MNSSIKSRFLDPKILAGSQNLHLVARTVVEGFVSGLHRSPFHGFSMEFAEYREYSPGDDIRRVDWKVYGRMDRFYVKKFEGDTNTQVFLLLDTSRSMAYSSGGVSKFDYGRMLAGSLAYFASRQNDAVGLLSFSDTIRNAVPPSTRHGQLNNILHKLDGMETAGETRIYESLKGLSKFLRKRSLVVLISDLYENPAEIGKALRFFHHRGNDVLVFHLLDPNEIEFPMGGIATLEDMETGEQVPFAGEVSRQSYLDELQRHIQQLKSECRSARIDYELMNTDTPLDLALFRYLSSRSRRV